MAERFTKPGTANVSARDKKKLKGILLKYKTEGFNACVRDQVKQGLTPDHAKRRCAVLLDLAHGHTRWRGKKKG